MRIEEGDHGAHRAVVFLDGRVVSHCTLADEEAGVVVVYETEVRGGYARAVADEHGKFRKVTKSGRVEIHFREPGPYSCKCRICVP